MFGRVFGARGRWGKRSRIAQVDLYTRGSLYVMIWLIPPYTLFLLAATASKGLGGAVENGAAVLLALVAPAQAVSAVRLLRRGIDQYRGRGTVPRGETVAGVALMTAALVPVAVLAAGDALGDGGLPVLLASLTVIPFLAPYALLAPLRTVVLVEAGWVAAVLAGFAVAGVDRQLLAGTALGLVFSCAWSAFTVRCSVWMLAVMYELEESRTVQARLAVAEERLRFARDMHDVMGRNLAVVALKSELAAQLSRRGSAAAVDQMVEVQRIAQESQREVREVVRGYREADLHTELVGAGAVLRSAGIDCRIDDRHPGGLSPAARSALGWVVREGTTNVLRHAEARHCAIRVRPGRAPDGGRTTVLVMENDGVPDGGPGGPPRPDGGHTDTSAGADGGAGSGLAGLRQRLAEAGGTVTAGPLAGCGFRLTAEVPDGVTGPGGSETGAAAGTGAGADTEAGVRGVDGDSSARTPAGTGGARADVAVPAPGRPAANTMGRTGDGGGAVTGAVDPGSAGGAGPEAGSANAGSADAASAGAPVRVLLADDEHLIRGALAALLSLEEDLLIVAEAATGPEALAMARAHRPDVAVLDLLMPGLDGVAVATSLRTELPACRSMIVTSYGRPGHLKRALAAGVRGFLPKTVSARRLAEIIRTVHAGQRYVDPELAADAISAGDSPLTAREAQLLELAADGAPVAEIARRAGLSPGTVRNYLSAAAAKLSAENRHTAVRIARERGWL